MSKIFLILTKNISLTCCLPSFTCQPTEIISLNLPTFFQQLLTLEEFPCNFPIPTSPCCANLKASTPIHISALQGHTPLAMAPILRLIADYFIPRNSTEYKAQRLDSPQCPKEKGHEVGSVHS